MRKFTEELTNQVPTRELQPDEYFHDLLRQMPYAPAGQVHLAGQGIHAAHPVQMPAETL